MGNDQLMAAPHRHDSIQILLVTDCGCWVMGIPENKKFELIPLAGGDQREIGSPSLFSGERERPDQSTCKIQSTAVRRITGIQMKRMVAWVEYSQGQMSRPLLRTDQQLHLSIRIDRYPETLLTPVGRSLMKGPHP